MTDIENIICNIYKTALIKVVDSHDLFTAKQIAIKAINQIEQLKLIENTDDRIN